jgi:4-diphosphocytidyl-2-C-methyl-D-erythritol kinase
MSPNGESLPCPAKINLFLEIQDRRPDGYHDLGTLFQTVEVADTLTAEPWDTLALDCPDGITADPAQNLVLKAARLLQESFADRIDAKAGIRFTLDKVLPMGAGLGGGSSNAAAALLLGNRIWKLGLTPEQLLPYAARLGADVPFFLLGDTQFGEGKGERLGAAPDPYPFHVVIATPRCHVDTAWAYGHLDPGRKRQWARFKALYVTFFEDPDFYRILHNDFHAPIARHFAPVRELAETMARFNPVKALLSGSGASVFGLFTEKGRAEECLAGVEGICRFSCLTEFTH